jgi:uncharacterized phage-associated protein
MPYPASTIAYAFVKRGIEQANPVTQMKLQKLIYFAHGIYLAAHHEPIINEHFQAWRFGPVIPQVYHEYKYYGSNPIMDTDWLFMFSKEPDLSIIDNAAQSAVNTTWAALKDANAIKLSNWTHQKGSPWSKFYVDGISDIIIPNGEIEKYFIETFSSKANADS